MPRKKPTAKQQEVVAAARRTPRFERVAPADPVLAFLLRRGVEVKRAEPDLPFPKGFDRTREFAELLDSYAFRLFVRGAILNPSGLAPAEATRYLEPGQAAEFAQALVCLGLARTLRDGRFQLLHPPANFGPTLEWYVAGELERRLGFAVRTGLLWNAKGVGGDLDLVALADGRLVYLELKSGPPKHLMPPEVACFHDRVHALRPDVALLALDTSLRLGDRVLPLVQEDLERRGGRPSPRNLVRDIWAITPHLYLANAKWDLVGNLALAIAEGLRALSPDPIGAAAPGEGNG